MREAQLLPQKIRSREERPTPGHPASDASILSRSVPYDRIRELQALAGAVTDARNAKQSGIVSKTTNAAVVNVAVTPAASLTTP